MSERKTRIWLASLIFGCSSSLILLTAMGTMRVAYWCPPVWPGLFLQNAYAMLRGGASSEHAGLVFIVGNAAFYTWIFSKVVRAEVTARGRLSRYFLR